VKRVQGLWNKLEKAGVRPEPLQLEWISAAERQKFAKVMRQLDELRKSVTEEEIAHARVAFKPNFYDFYDIKNIKAVTEIVYTVTSPPDYWNERGYSKYDGL
jgi:hypothetical protein